MISNIVPSLYIMKKVGLKFLFRGIVKLYGRKRGLNFVPFETQCGSLDMNR